MRTLRPGLSGDDHLAIGFLRGVFLANHLKIEDMYHTFSFGKYIP